MKKVKLLIVVFCFFGAVSRSLYAQDITFSFLPPVLIKSSVGNTSFYFSPGLGFDLFNRLVMGCDFGIDQQIKDWNFSMGFGIGLNLLSAGGFVSYKKFGAGYYAAFYGNIRLYQYARQRE